MTTDTDNHTTTSAPWQEPENDASVFEQLQTEALESQQDDPESDDANHYRDERFEPLGDLSRLSLEDEISSLPMPDSETAAAGMDIIMGTWFDIFKDTRLEPIAYEMATRYVLAALYIADLVKRRLDDAVSRARDISDDYDGSEIADVNLQEQLLIARSWEEAHNVMTAILDRAMDAYHVQTGQPFSTSRRASAVHSRRAQVLIDLADFRRGLRLQEMEKLSPQGPRVLFSGGDKWHDNELIYSILDQIKQRIPNMILLTTAQENGADKIAESWALLNNVRTVKCIPKRNGGKLTSYQAWKKRNDQMLEIPDIVHAVLLEGNTTQHYLYKRLDAKGVPLDTYNLDQQRPAPTPKRNYADQRA